VQIAPTCKYCKCLSLKKRAIRTLSGLGPRDTCREAIQEPQDTIVSLYILETILHEVKSNQTRLGNIHTYNTRNRHNFLLNTHHLSHLKKPSYKGAVFYNQLPEDLKRLPEKNLKTGMTNRLMDRSIYTTQEFLE
jgi:hypothetical protein